MTGHRFTLAASLAGLLGTLTYAVAPAPQSRGAAGTPGPWNNDILLVRSDTDGRVSSLASFPRAGVSTLARLADGRVMAAHQHFPADRDEDFDKVAVRFSSDDGRTWTAAQVIRLTGLPDGMRFPFDPTLLVLPDGRIRLYFTSLKGRRFDEDVPAIYSAISSNGLDFAVEPGLRFGIQGRPVIDCAVIRHDGVFHLFAPDNGAAAAAGPRGEPQPADGIGYHATSRDGLSFTRVDDVRVEGRRRWLGAVHSDGTVMTFFGTGGGGGGDRGRGPAGRVGIAPPVGPPRPPAGGGIWMATSRDGIAWTIVPAPAVPGADPGAIPARDGGWLWSVTGPPRGQGAPSLPPPPTPPVAGAQAPYVPRQSDRPSAIAGDEPGFRPIFDGTSLSGWDGDPKYLARGARRDRRDRSMRNLLVVSVCAVLTVTAALNAQTNARPISQGRSVCVPYDPAGLKVEAIENGAWRLERADGAIFKIFDNREDADAGLVVAREHTQLCYIGKSNTRPNRIDYIMEYWK